MSDMAVIKNSPWRQDETEAAATHARFPKISSQPAS